jgi:hypothetical protein
MFKDPISCYEAIAATLSKSAQNNWDEIKVEIGLNDAQIDAVVTCILSSNSGVSHLTGVPMLARYFFELARLVSTEEKGLFKRCVFVLQKNGKYDVKFSY